MAPSPGVARPRLPDPLLAAGPSSSRSENSRPPARTHLSSAWGVLACHHTGRRTCGLGCNRPFLLLDLEVVPCQSMSSCTNTCWRHSACCFLPVLNRWRQVGGGSPTRSSSQTPPALHLLTRPAGVPGSFPDEEALVTAARNFGYVFRSTHAGHHPDGAWGRVCVPGPGHDGLQQRPQADVSAG